MSEENKAWYEKVYEQIKRDYENKSDCNSSLEPRKIITFQDTGYIGFGHTFERINVNPMNGDVSLGTSNNMDYYRYEPSVPKMMINCDGQYGFGFCSPRFKRYYLV